MNEANFVKRMNWIATGDVVLREQILPLTAFKDDADSDLIDAGSAPTLVATGVSFADGEVAFFDYYLPMDYDSSADQQVLKFLVQPTGNASDFGVLTTKRRTRPGVAVSATAGTAKAEASTTSASLAREVFLSLSGDSHQPGDFIRRSVDANVASGEAVVVAQALIYGSSISAYNDDDRHRNMSFTTGD
jgi:hypothetical protein